MGDLTVTSRCQGSSLATAPRYGLALTTWTPVEAGSGPTTRPSSTSTGRVVRRGIRGAGWPGDPTGTQPPIYSSYPTPGELGWGADSPHLLDWPHQPMRRLPVN